MPSQLDRKWRQPRFRHRLRVLEQALRTQRRPHINGSDVPVSTQVHLPPFVLLGSAVAPAQHCVRSFKRDREEDVTHTVNRVPRHAHLVVRYPFALASQADITITSKQAVPLPRDGPERDVSQGPLSPATPAPLGGADLSRLPRLAIHAAPEPGAAFGV